MSETKNMLIVGVGGQGTLLASKLFGRVLLDRNADVKVSEVHGMSQRGGSVVTYVRWGDRVFSPLVDIGCADMILSFEPLEAARWLSYLKKGGAVVTSAEQIDPMPVIMGKAEYNADVAAKLKSAGADVAVVDAVALAEQAGSRRSVNMALVGAAAKKLGFSKEEFFAAIELTVPQKTAKTNKRAFELGYEA